MIFKSKKLLDVDHSGSAIIDMSFEGDKFIILHGQEIDSTLKSNHYEQMSDNNGWSKGRQFRKIGSIPDIVFSQHPEFLKDPRLTVRWLKSDAGKPFRTVRKGI